MRKQIILGIALLGMVAFSNSVSANSVVESNMFQTSLYAENLMGNYDGSLTYVYMNGEKDPVSNITSNVTDNGDGTVNIHIDGFKIGSMPGSITVDAMDITVPASGNFNQTCNDAVKLKIGFIPLKYDALVSGSFSGNHLNYTVTVNAEYSSAPFTAIVTFDGDKVSASF